MNRILILLASLLVMAPPAKVLGGDSDEWASGESFSTFDISAYKRLCNHSNCFLVADDDDLWIYGGGFGYGTSTTDFSERVLIRCRQMSKSPSSCRVLDRFGESDFIKSLHFPVAAEQFCYETYHEEYGEAKWRDMVDAIRNQSTGYAANKPLYADFRQLTIRCASFLSADSTTWIGNDTSQYLVTVDRTIEEYEECYSAVHSEGLRVGSRVHNKWSDVVEDAWSGNASSAAPALLNQCSPFLSSDQLTWTAPLPEELNGQSEEATKVARIPEATQGSASVDLEFWQSKTFQRAIARQIAAAMVEDDQPVQETIDLSGYWKLEHTIASSAGTVEPYTLILQLKQDGNSVSSLKVVELPTAEGIPCNGNGGSFDIDGEINGSVFAGTISSANLDGRFSLTGNHKELAGTYNSRWLAGICAGEMSGLVNARRVPEDAIQQLTSSNENNAVIGGNQSASKTTSREAGMSGVEQSCFDDFHRYGGSEWRRAVRGQAADGPVDDIDLYKCKPFVSKDMKTWIGSDPDTGGSISSESVSNNNQAQNVVQSNSGTLDNVVARREWCVTSSGVSNRSYSECLGNDGIPTRIRSGPEVDRATSYFGEWKKSKAFAISADNLGYSGSWNSAVDAIKRSLLNCYIYSSAPVSCRVVNVNGLHEKHSDKKRSRDPAFGATGSVNDLAGKYYFELNYQGLDGTLRVTVSGTDISATLETCIEGLCTDWTLGPNPFTYGGRRLAGLMKRGAKGQGWGARQIYFQASFSESTNRIVGNFGLYEFEGTKRSSN